MDGTWLHCFQNPMLLIIKWNEAYICDEDGGTEREESSVGARIGQGASLLA